MEAPGYCVHRTFESAGPTEFRMDRHYFVYALSGSMRLEAGGNRWTLTPSRGALITARQSIEITIPAPVTTASVLFDTGMLAPIDALRVFDVSPLCRELVRACRPWGAGEPQDDYSALLFRTLAAEVRKLSETPSPCYLPVPRSLALVRAVALTEQAIATSPRFEEIANAVGQSARTLARRFNGEMGITWREVLRRMRIMRAVELLAERDSSITAVALDVGYSSLSAFNSAFRDLTGMSPTAYCRSLGER